MSIPELFEILSRKHYERVGARINIIDPEIKLMCQRDDAQRWIRPDYNNWLHTCQKIGILTGDTSHLDVANATHMCHDQFITDIEIEFINKNIILPENPDWKAIKKMFNNPEILWAGRPDKPTTSKKQFKWVSNIQQKHTDFPVYLDFMMDEVHPYFGQRTPNIAVHVVKLLKAFDLEYKYIPCAPHPQTVKKCDDVWERVLSDYDENGLKYEKTQAAQKCDNEWNPFLDYL